jgi:hypothetical protein
MAKTKITVEEFKNFYLKMAKGNRSIRKLHTELKTKFKTKSLPSLPTIFRHSKSENWLQLCNLVDQKSSAIVMDKIVEKKAVQLTEITEQLKETSDKALQIVLQNLNNIKSLDKVADIGTISKVAIESAKLSNLFSGGATSISSTFISDGQDVASLKNHIKELYDSIQNDISKQQQPTNLKLVKDTKH